MISLVNWELLRSFNSMADDLSRTAYLQKDFISSISHEFKTPIASIKGYARLLQMPGLDEESRNEYVNMIAGESERLSHMSQTLLRLTSLEEQMMPATVTTFRLDEQLREVLVQLAPAWENRKIDWQLELSPVTIASDEELLRQVWVNLIQNAVKFSDEGGIIEIHVYAAGDAVVEVTDHGIGMDEATMARIYDRFYQADTSRSREGVGLGLCLVKRIVDILGGTIRVHSKPGRAVPSGYACPWSIQERRSLTMASDPRTDRVAQLTEQFQEIVEHYFSIQCRYQSAIREVQTKLEILDDEFQSKHSRNPIHHMQSRMKSLPSITEKLRRKGIP